MKRLAAFALAVLTAVSLAACGEKKDPITAEAALTALQENIQAVTSIEIFDEDTDPNGNLGKPKQYTSKGDFYDINIKDEYAGTIEVFASKDDCDSRYEYLCTMADPSMGAFGVNQYIYKYDLAVFRVSFDLSTKIAAAYKNAMDTIMEEESTQYGVE